MHSVVIIRPATEAAFCSAERVTLVGIEDTHGDHVAILAGTGVVAVVAFAFSHLVEDHGGLVTGVG